MDEIFKQNYSVIYKPKRGKYQETMKINDLINQNLYVTNSESFLINFEDVFKGYKDSFIVGDDKNKDHKLLDEWTNYPMKLYQTQLNLAVHISTTLCGISDQHLKHKNNMVRSIYLFHTYYQIKKVLKYLRITLPFQKDFDGLNSTYDTDRFVDLISGYDLNEFVFKNESVYSSYQQHRPLYKNPGPAYFTDNSWSRWILDKSEGLTKAGVELLSESVMVYVVLVLTSQLMGKSGLVGGDGKSLVAQNIFLREFEKDVIKRDFRDYGNLVQLYQKVLIDARSKVDFVVGEGVYMLPSDLRLKLDGVSFYENKLFIANSDMKIGTNYSVNSTSKPTEKHKFQETKKKSKVIIHETKSEDSGDKKEDKTDAQPIILPQVDSSQKYIKKGLLVLTMTTVFVIALYTEYKAKKK